MAYGVLRVLLIVNRMFRLMEEKDFTFIYDLLIKNVSSLLILFLLFIQNHLEMLIPLHK